MFCMHVIRDRTDQLDNKDTLKEFIKRNEQAIVHIYQLKTFGCS